LNGIYDAFKRERRLSKKVSMGEPDLFLFSLCCWDTCPGLSADPSKVVRKDKNLVSMAKKKESKKFEKRKKRFGNLQVFYN